MVAACELDTGAGRFAIEVPGLFDTVDDIRSMPIEEERLNDPIYGALRASRVFSAAIGAGEGISAVTQEANEPAVLDPDEFIQDAVRLAAEERLPIEMGRIVWRPDGRLERRGEGESLTFKCVYRGVRFEGRLDLTETGKMAITADLGPLPYTAEASGTRHQIIRLARGAVSKRGLHFIISQDQVLRIAAEGTTPRPRTPVSCVATLCSLLLCLRPWLELSDDLMAAARSAETLRIAARRSRQLAYQEAGAH